MMGTVIVTGGTGMLGTAVVRAFKVGHSVVSVASRSKSRDASKSVVCDLTDEKAATGLVAEYRPDVIVHCAAMTNVDECERDPSRAYEVNVRATEYLAKAQSGRGLFVYVSTDAVYDGGRGMHAEEDRPGPINVYARTKLDGERAVEASLGRFVIVRLNVIGHRPVHGGSLAEWVADNLSEGKAINMFTDVIISPLDTASHAELILKLVCSGYHGIMNLGCRKGISKYELGVGIAKNLSLDHRLIYPKSVDEMAFAAKRPKDMSLDIRRAEAALGEMPNVDLAISRWCDEHDMMRLSR